MMSVFLAYLKTPRIQIAALVYFLAAGALTQIPLFNYLGYEFAAIMTIPAACISGTLTILFMREHRDKPLTRRTWLFVVMDYIVVNAVLLLIPLIVISLNAVVVKNCAFAQGLVYFLLLPYCTMIFSVAMALVAGTLSRHGLALLYLIISVIVLHIVVVTYFQPQLFAYNFILGFFPGITYDETLSDQTLLVIYRQFTIIASFMLFSLFFILLRTYDANAGVMENLRSVRRNISSDKPLWSVVAVCAAVLISGHLFRAEIGFEYSSADIQQKLGRRSESKHFIFYYRENDYAAEDMRRTKAEAEYHFQKISRELRVGGRSGDKIEVFVYPDGAWKQQFIGTTTTNIAKPWNRQIHLTVSTMASTFRHELVHILAGEFGFPIIRASTRMGLNEGLAVAADWDEGLFSPHRYAAALEREQGLEFINSLFTYTGFARQSGSLAYITAGSFSRYLIDRFGIERFQLVFPNGNFVAAFGEPLDRLTNDWRAFLRTVDVSELPPKTIRSMFFHPSIFYKTCPRRIAEQQQNGMKAIRTKNYQEAEREFSSAYENAPTISSFRGILHAKIALRLPGDVTALYSALDSTSPIRHHPSVMLLAADAYMMLRQENYADVLYKEVREMNYSESFIEASALRMQCFNDGMDQEIFYALFYSGMEDSLKSKIAEEALTGSSMKGSKHYLRAIFSAASGEERARLFTIASKAVTSDDLKYFSLRRAAHHYFIVNRIEDAKSLYWQAKNYAPTEGMSVELDERIEMCDYVSLELL